MPSEVFAKIEDFGASDAVQTDVRCEELTGVTCGIPGLWACATTSTCETWCESTKIEPCPGYAKSL